MPNRLLVNRSGEHFTNRSYELGAGHLLKGHGAAFGDLDEDGHQEIYQVQGGDYPVDQGRNILLDGDTTGNNWITINLVGTRSPKSGRGSRIRLRGRTSDGDTRVIHHRVSTGFSFGASPLRAKIGLGVMTRADTLTIKWTSDPDNPPIIDAPPINETITVHEDRGLLR